MRIIALTSTLLIASVSAVYAAPEDCAPIASDLERLTCFDGYFPAPDSNGSWLATEIGILANELFERTKSGNFESIKSNLLSGGYMDSSDRDNLTRLFIQSNAVAAYFTTVEKDSSKAKVQLVLTTDSGTFTGPPLNLVYADGVWRVDYSGLSWPLGLRLENIIP